jgi:hypothetical protein
VYAAVLHQPDRAVGGSTRPRVFQAPDTDQALQTFNDRVKIKVGGEGVADRGPDKARNGQRRSPTTWSMLDRVNHEANTSARQARIFIEGAAENGTGAARICRRPENTGVVPEDQLEARSTERRSSRAAAARSAGVMRPRSDQPPGLVGLERGGRPSPA